MVRIFRIEHAAGYLIEDAFAECPEMSEQYTGFTFYPNTISFGSWTIQGAPGLYGGYEYTPWSMNHRRDIPMQEKHNQALSMLAFMFENEGFSSYVIDPPYPNYDTTPVFSFYLYPSMMINYILPFRYLLIRFLYSISFLIKCQSF